MKVDADCHDQDKCDRHELGMQNKREERLLTFFWDHDLFIINKPFKQHERRRYIWQLPDGVYRTQIDFVLVKKTVEKHV